VVSKVIHNSMFMKTTLNSGALQGGIWHGRYK
jgi:hypothetical protein